MKPKIPFLVAILININIVIGSAFFMNAGKISMLSGALAPFSWLLCGVLLAPLVVVLAQLASLYPTAGGLYVYSSKLLGDVWGFMSGWGYFVGTAAANGAVIHAFSTQLFSLQSFNQWTAARGLGIIQLDLILVVIFTLCNLMNISFFERAQMLFTAFKALPLALVILALPFLANFSHISISSMDVTGLMSTLPLVLFAYVGIEACCAVADQLENAKKNASRVILTSFFLIVSIYTVLQVALYLIHGPHDNNPFLSIIPMLTSNQTMIVYGNALVNLGLLASFLAGFYGMYYFNNWNLYAIAQERSIIFHKQFSRLNLQGVPWVAVLMQALLVGAFITIGSENYGLISMGDLGTLIAYLLSIISFLVLKRSIIGFASLASCSLLIINSAQSLFDSGALWYFIGVITVGLICHLLARSSKQK